MSRVYVDSMVWIYALEADPRFGAQAQRVLKAVRGGAHTLLASHFLLAELLVYPEKDGNVFLSTSYRRTFHGRDIEMLPFTERTATAFARVRAQHRVSSPDAIHLAVAATNMTDWFVTVDARLLKLAVPGIGRIVDLSYSFA